MGISRYIWRMKPHIPRIYYYILGTYTVKRLLYFESGFVGLATPTVLSSTLLACFVRCDLPLECLLNTQTTQAGLATCKTPQPQVNFVDIAAQPSVSSCRVGTAIREAWILALAEHVRDRWSWVSSQKKGDKGDPARHVGCRSHIETGSGGLFIQSCCSSELTGGCTTSLRAASRCAPRNPEVKYADHNDVYWDILTCHQYISV